MSLGDRLVQIVTQSADQNEQYTISFIAQTILLTKVRRGAETTMYVVNDDQEFWSLLAKNIAEHKDPPPIYAVEITFIQRYILAYRTFRG